MYYIDLYDGQQFLKFQEEIQNYNNNQNYNKSTNILKEAIKCFPNHPGLCYLFALTYYNCREYLKATEYLKKAIYHDDKNDKYLGLIGCCFFQINDFESAYNYSKKAYEIDKSNLDAILTLGKLELIRSNFQEATQYAKLANNISKDNFKALRFLSKCYIAQDEDCKRILDLLYRAKRFGNDDDLDFDIIKFLYMNKEFGECLQECKKAIMNNANSYIVQKATKFVFNIYNKEINNESELIEAIEQDASLKKFSKIKNNDDLLESKLLTETKNNKVLKNHQESMNTKENLTDKQKKNEIVKEEVLDKEEENSLCLQESLDKLNSLIGLENVKLEIKRIVQLIKYEKNRCEILNIETNLSQSYHFAFLGNPGTGKTTVARLIGDIFYYLGILEKGQLIEVDRSDIVGRYVGETAKLTKKAIDSAIGGILFIDEAYSLSKGGSNSNDYGIEAIETLIKSMEDYRGKFTVILAGYTREMRDLIKLNPGLKSRINLEIEFQDYNDDELLDIAKSMASENHYKFSDNGEKAFLEKINTEKVEENFSNGRASRNILEEAIREKAFRIGDSKVSKEELITLNAEDFGINLEFDARDKMNELQKELDDLVGLEDVKGIVKGIINTLELQHRKKEMGIESTDISLNMMFVGNPGTGKTSVARIIGKILKNIGVLKKGHMVEVTRNDLVGQYVGQTGPKTLDKIKEAYGGILFIDEAYTLNANNSNDFGKEALATLIKEMEDSRDKLLVILAGYTKEMKSLLDLNPGLESRIKFIVEFSDYNSDDLIEIFKGLCKKEDYIISDKALKKLQKIFKNECDNKDNNFGNGRYVRKYFENVKMKQADRIIRDDIREKEAILKIILEDVQILK